jgi:outer membrane protein
MLHNDFAHWVDPMDRRLAMFRNGIAALGLLAICAVATTASASEPSRVATGTRQSPLAGAYLHVGPAGLVLNEGAKIRAAGQPLVGADISVESQLKLGIEAGYFLNPNVAVSLTGGIPPVAKIELAGTMSGMGAVGKTTYGPVGLTAHYQFRQLGRLQPYAGLGPVLFYVFDDEDGLMTHLKARHSVGFALQAGADLMLEENWGVFIDVKKVFLQTQASGTLGGIPIKADVRLDPLVVHSGVTYRF